jgi:hypothetical protein
MSSLLGSSEVLGGVALIVLWVIALRLFKGDKPLSAMRFAFWPSLLLLWIVLGILLVAHGVGVV